ncbi:hypothetical protein LX99_00455 [Mucilaginibacter oryzae]|uniref:Uncharacterized protein n=1 Tax=Mucilaginibacter oryzae TaxID=468058 RepID=A0A316HFL0_9SPHI|nr:hypothetical protein [Mucilaginibacter oryzae]PWK79994.1 hypothetical protein LX99_00455 [Mucilaginibacter oryzae]
MSYFYIFLTGGSVLVFLILQFDKQQRKRVNTLLKSTNNVQPLLMMRSLGEKLDRINTVLTANAYQVAMPDSTKQEIELMLKQTTSDYHKGHISMQVYHNKLSELLEKAGEK